MRWLAALALLSAPAIAAAPKTEDVAAYRALAAVDGRVATIGYRLAAASSPFCKHKARNPGWVLNGIAQFEDAETAAAAFGFEGGGAAIVALVPDGPAAKMGLSVGDTLHSIPNTRWSAMMHVPPRPDASGMEDLRQMLARLWANKDSIDFEFDAKERRKTITFAPPEICASDFWVDTSSKVDAGADGDRVRVTKGLTEFAADDNELAAAIAHELAHNILGHRARLNGLKKGKTKATLATEIEADRLSVWLMANAGYDTNAALRFAERYGRKYGLGIFNDGTHPRWPKRVGSMQEEIALIAATPAKDGLRDPPLLSAYRNPQ
jgi:beta-barrel assembly-enhancing protease